KLAVVLTKRTSGRSIARIGEIRTSRPFPHIPEHLHEGVGRLAYREGVEGAIIEKIARLWPHVSEPRRHFPLHLGWQTLPRPAGIGVGFVITHVGHRDMWLHFPPAGQRHGIPRIIELLPVERGLPALTLHGVPAVGQPVPKVGIAAVVYKSEVFAVGDWTILEHKVLGVGPMDGLLIIKAKIPPVVPDIIRTPRERQPLHL